MLGRVKLQYTHEVFMSRKVCRAPAVAAMEVRRDLPERLTAFMLKYRLDFHGMSILLHTAEQTVRKWQKGVNTPPGMMKSLLDLLERSEEAREIAGMRRLRNNNFTKARLTRNKKDRAPITTEKESEPIPVRSPVPLASKQERQSYPQAASSEPEPFDEELFVEGSMDIWAVTVPLEQ